MGVGAFFPSTSLPSFIPTAAAFLVFGLGTIANADPCGFSFPHINSYETGFTFPQHFAVGDFNRDGLDDLLVTGDDINLSLMLGTSNGGFESPLKYAIPANEYPAEIALGDFNQDGNLDVAVIAPGVSPDLTDVFLLLGDGRGGFSQPASYEIPASNPSAVITTDLDGDGQTDVVVGTLGSPGGEPPKIWVLYGRGDGSLATSLPLTFPNKDSGFWFMTPADFDGDGVDDIVAVNISPFIIRGSRSRQPIVEGIDAPLGPNLLATDINEDGHPDLVSTGGNDVVIVFNDGFGHFTNFTSVVNSDTDLSGLAVADMNHDRRPDLVEVTFEGTLTTMFGNTAGSFSSGDHYFGGLNPVALAVLDAPNPGERRIVTLDSNDGVIWVVPVDRQGHPKSPRIYRDAAPAIMGDFNNDGVLDFFTSSNEVLLGSGDGTFRSSDEPSVPVPAGRLPQRVIPSSLTRGFFAADFNGDGNLDVALAGTESFVILSGNGNGSFGQEIDNTFPIPANLVVADVNGDGRPDLIGLGSTFQTSELYSSVRLGKGDGTFGAEIVTLLGSKQAASQTLFRMGDFDGDGNLDTMIYDQTTVIALNPAISVIFGKGDGTFSGRVDYEVKGTPFGAIAGKFSGSTADDLAVSLAPKVRVDGVVLPGGIQIIHSTGNRSFVDGPRYSYPRANVIAEGDFDGDGVIDLFAVEAEGPVEVFPGVGDGTFRPPVVTVSNAPPGYFGFFDLGDFNSDGRIDIATVYSSAMIILQKSSIEISPDRFPLGFRGLSSSIALSAVGGKAPYRFEVSSGALPEGLHLDSNTNISGVPTTVGSYRFDLTVTDGQGCRSDFPEEIDIVEPVLRGKISPPSKAVGTPIRRPH